MAALIKYPSLLRNTTNALMRLSLSTQSTEPCLARKLEQRFVSVTALRHKSAFTQMSLTQLWEGCTSVSNQGRKKGRGKRGSAKRRINIHAGKGFGYSKEKTYYYPGFNTKIVTGKEIVKMSSVEKDPNEEEKLLQARTKFDRYVRLKKFPLERGWSGGRLPGTSHGPPDPYQDYTFEGFDSRVLEFKMVSHMTGNLGRKMSYSAMVVVGNGQGLVGTAVGKGSLGMPAVRKAKNMAAQRLHYINLKDNRTIWHEFYAKVGATKVFAAPKPEGYGLVCHRAIKTIAQCIGIKDMYVKCEGRTKNIQNVGEAFIGGLLKMETHQDLANKTGYYVVELSDQYKVPTVLAEPSDKQVKDKPLENFNIERHYMEGKTILRKPPKVLSYKLTGRYLNQERKVFKKMRNQRRLQIERKAAAIE